VIPATDITAWGLRRPWPTRAAIEQDLLLARTIIAIYQHPKLRDELAFRGGTCLHQVLLDEPRRYSEDLDFVRRTSGPIGGVLDAVRDVADEVGLEIRDVSVKSYPKMRLVAQAENDPQAQLRIKIEINTYERSPARPLIRRPFQISNAWFTGATEILTFCSEELIATKLRALYERKKGRDLFDLWLAITELGLKPTEIIECFAPYRPGGYTPKLAAANLRAKVIDRRFNSDLLPLVAEWPAAYNVTDAAEMVIDSLISRIDSSP
jgi:predicted nucleotidyltransferase component of viral defense system